MREAKEGKNGCDIKAEWGLLWVGKEPTGVGGTGECRTAWGKGSITTRHGTLVG